MSDYGMCSEICVDVSRYDVSDGTKRICIEWTDAVFPLSDIRRSLQWTEDVRSCDHNA